jgi:superfamily II DNA/RNA helicase
MESFSRLGLAESLAQALASFGFETPTQVQAEAVPILLSRRDAIIESETGTGKTFAYLAPAFQLVSTLDRKSSGEPGALIAVPTQELAVQIGRESERLAKAADLPLRTVVLLGGTSIDKQAAKLKAKPDIVVGTLGRLADLVALGRLRTTALKVLVLDEADRLFAKETEVLAVALLKSAPSACARVLVSATIPEKQRREMRPLLREPAEISPLGDAVLSGSIEHWCFYCDGRKRLDFMRRFEAALHPERCLLFITMATRVEKAALALDHLGLPIAAIHSGMDKEDRRVALEQFVSGEVRYLLTSDLGARGLDIAGISHVISLDLPEEAAVLYTHRAGRTGRAGAKGVSIVLADGIELKRASKIATKGGFVFRCKVLEEGKVLEPTSEEFFARAGAAEDQRMAAKAAKLGDDEERGAKKRRPASGAERGSGEKPRFRRDREGSNRSGASTRSGASSRGGASDRGERDDRKPYRAAYPREDTRHDGHQRPAYPRSAYPRDASPFSKAPPRDAHAGEEPPEAPRTARAPKVAPWRPAAEGEKAERSGPTIPRLRKKDSLRDEAAREAAPPRETPRRAPASSDSRRPPAPRERPASREGAYPRSDRPRDVPSRGDRPHSDRREDTRRSGPDARRPAPRPFAPRSSTPEGARPSGARPFNKGGARPFAKGGSRPFRGPDAGKGSPKRPPRA